jgi:hypothetical protein
MGQSHFLNDQGGADRAKAPPGAILSGANAMGSFAEVASRSSNSRSLVAALTQY